MQSAQWKRPQYGAGYRDGRWTIFRARYTPTWATDGHRFDFVFGMYRTRAEARAMAVRTLAHRPIENEMPA